MRRQFQLAEEDEGCLTARNPNWEAIVERGAKWVIIPDFPIVAGYNHPSASLAMRIPPSYPDDQIDMAYFFPGLALASGRAVRQLTPFALDGKQFQQWSRHRKAGEWRPGIDSIGTHMLQVEDWLQKELRG